MSGRKRNDRGYVKELLEFEPKMRSMISNFHRCGYRFSGHDDDDLAQELFVKALDIEDKYDAEKAAIRTWWYRCFVAHLVRLAERGDRVMRWSVDLDGVEFAVADPMIVSTNGWRKRAIARVDEMMRMLRVEDPQLARMCEAIMDLEGDKVAAAKALKVEPCVIDHGLWRLRQWQPYQDAIACVPL